MKIINLSKNSSFSASKDQFAIDVLTGLSSTPKQLSSKYFYDDLGSSLFQKITRQPDYYVTNKEYLLLEKISSSIPPILPNAKTIDIIELGVGDGHKSKLIIDAFLATKTQVNFYPVDISEQAMTLLKDNITSSSQLAIEGIVADYFDGLSHLQSLSKNPKLVLFLGSNIGNFNPQQSLNFMCNLWRNLNNQDYMLIGFDQKKDVAILNNAYNDSSGYTAAFNLNLLTRINRELSANFTVDKFKHYGFYNPNLGAMESHLISLFNQEVTIDKLRRTFTFKKFEPIHLEYSYKFLPSDIEKLSTQAGYSLVKNFMDDEGFFLSSLWTVNKLSGK